MEYIPKVANVYVVTLVLANTWYQVLTKAQAKYIRGIKVKSRYTYGQTTPKPFDIAFSDSPDENDSSGSGFISYSGSGFGDTFGPTSGMWARSAVAGVVLEVITYG